MKTTFARPLIFFLWLSILLAVVTGANAAKLRTENVFLIISDGLRWQEVFSGAEEQLMTQESGGVKNTNALRQAFWRETPEARRQALLPFFWNEIAKRGQLFGNQTKGSVSRVTNGKNFSYPGYNEITTGAPDPRVDSNDKIPNRNVTVFEWLNGRPRFRNRVAVLGTWDVFPYIFNVERSHLPVWPAWEEKMSRYEVAAPQHITELMRDTTELFDGVTYDSFLAHTALDYVKRKKPRVTFIGFGETDEYAHAGRYDQYLKSAQRVDKFVQRLWQTVQSIPQYRGKTTMVLTADHGRGTEAQWRDHGEKIQSSEGDWIAIIGPDTPPLGERTNCAPVTQGQIAATIAALLGEDYRAAFPNVGTPIAEAIGGGK